MSIKATIEGDKVVKVNVNGYEFPCDVEVGKWDEMRSLLEKLIKLGAFKRKETLPVSSIVEFANSLTPNERKLIMTLPTDRYISMETLKKELGMNGRGVGALLANIDKKAFKYGLAPHGEMIYTSKWENGQYHYKLREEFKILREYVRGGISG